MVLLHRHLLLGLLRHWELLARLGLLLLLILLLLLGLYLVSFREMSLWCSVKRQLLLRLAERRHLLLGKHWLISELKRVVLTSEHHLRLVLVQARYLLVSEGHLGYALADTRLGLVLLASDLLTSSKALLL